MFEGIVGASFDGDIALDDISIRRESCQVQPLFALPQIQAANLVNCDFENTTLCNWKNEPLQKANWVITKGQTDSFGETGPSSGAMKTLQYIFVNSKLSNARGKIVIER
jgi:hypothetical protein